MYHLKHYQEFKQILNGYQVSEQKAATLKDLKLVLMLGVTSSGRNTVIRRLLETGGYHYIVSDTTRQPRANDGVMEQNGREYWFKTENEVLAGLKSGDYLEAELIHDQQVSGISLHELLSAKQQQKIAITDIDIQGMHNIVRAKPDTIAIMLLPPSYDEWQRRLARRGRMSREEQIRRLETAYRVFEDGVKQTFYKFIIAEDVSQSVAIIKSLTTGGSNPHQDRGRELIHQIQTRLRDAIQSSRTGL